METVSPLPELPDVKVFPQLARKTKPSLEQAQVLRQKIAAEVSALETYAQNLDSLDQQARLLVGELAILVQHLDGPDLIGDEQTPGPIRQRKQG